MRPLAFVALAILALALIACEKPDASYVTSPSLKTLIGTTTGNVAFNPPEAAPAPKAPAEDWRLDFGLARFTELENGNAAIEFVSQVATRPGAGFELWLESADGVAARWSAGSTAAYVGTLCFQLELQGGTESVPIGPGPHAVTLVFREPGGEPLAARRLTVTNTTPHLTGATPAATSAVFRDALACRRGQ